MTQLDYSLGSPRTPLNLQSGFDTYFSAQENKRRNYDLKRKKQEDQKERTIAEMVAMNTDDQGRLNRGHLSQALLSKGYLDENDKILSDFRKQDQEQERQQYQAFANWQQEQKNIAQVVQEKEDKENKTLGKLSEYYMTADDKHGAFNTILDAMTQEKIEIPSNWMQKTSVDPEVDRDMQMIFTRWGDEKAKKALSPAYQKDKDNLGELPRDYNAYLKDMQLGHVQAGTTYHQWKGLQEESKELGKKSDDVIVQLGKASGTQERAKLLQRLGLEPEIARLVSEMTAKGKIAGSGNLPDLLVSASETQSFDDIINQTESIIEELHKEGGVRDPNKGFMENLAIYGKQSGIGQVLQTAAGTYEQSLRDQLNSMGNTIAFLKRSSITDSGSTLGATMMNTAREMEKVMSAVINQKGDINVLRRNIKNLRQKKTALVSQVSKAYKSELENPGNFDKRLLEDALRNLGVDPSSFSGRKSSDPNAGLLKTEEDLLNEFGL